MSSVRPALPRAFAESPTVRWGAAESQLPRACTPSRADSTGGRGRGEVGVGREARGPRGLPSGGSPGGQGRSEGAGRVRDPRGR